MKGFWRYGPMSAASAGRLATRSPIRYASVMSAARPLRKALALVLAYTIVLGGVTGGYALASGNMQPICAPSADNTDRGTGPGPLSSHAAPDCCPGLCSGQAAVTAPVPPLVYEVSFSPIEWRPLAQRAAVAGFSTAKLARAPPRD